MGIWFGSVNNAEDGLAKFVREQFPRCRSSEADASTEFCKYLIKAERRLHWLY